MKRVGNNTPTRLRDLNRDFALARCIGITQPIWSDLDYKTVHELWEVFNSYILNGYQDTDIQVPSRISDVWLRCKKKIDKEARK